MMEFVSTRITAMTVTALFNGLVLTVNVSAGLPATTIISHHNH